ncbi:tape measure protein [Sphingomonas naphthae]|uniref:Tape measure protein n=1 Tax=Sphingomonas naphthae TaxID=1813468 RepID=A0ABY7TGF3_9SPHN|nr:tape measure protein [Sphingomonas naphthae]WCT72051.1 tape measure protein [Sphingomonas naphthae]
MRRASRGVEAVTRSTRSLVVSAGRAGVAMDRMATRGVGALARLDRRFELTRRTARRTGEFIGSTIRGGALALGGAAITGLWATITTGARFEGFRSQMEGIEGSSGKAERSLKWIADFAKTTPYQLEDVVAAFIKSRNLGIDPMDGSLRSLGDAAGALGKSLDDAVEMMADAQTGEFERLKEFGIVGSQKGATATFRYMTKAGKTASVSVAKDAKKIQAALLTIFDAKFAGGMDRQSRTVAGKWSNLMDFLGGVARRVWDGGFGKMLDRNLAKLLAWTEKAERDGSLDKWATKVGDGLARAGDAIARTDWKAVGDDINYLAGTVRDLAGGLADLVPILRELDRWREKFGRFQAAADGVAAKVWGAADAADRYFPDQWGKYLFNGQDGKPLRYPSAPKPRWSIRSPRTEQERAPGWSLMQGRAPLVRPVRPPQLAPSWQRIMANPRRLSTSPAAPRLGPPLRRATPARPQAPVKVGGKLDIHITTDRGTQARTTKLSSVNRDVPIDVSRGFVPVA